MIVHGTTHIATGPVFASGRRGDVVADLRHGLAVKLAKDKALKDELKRLRDIHYRLEPKEDVISNPTTKLLKRGGARTTKRKTGNKNALRRK